MYGTSSSTWWEFPRFQTPLNTLGLVWSLVFVSKKSIFCPRCSPGCFFVVFHWDHRWSPSIPCKKEDVSGQPWLYLDPWVPPLPAPAVLAQNLRRSFDVIYPGCGADSHQSPGWIITLPENRPKWPQKGNEKVFQPSIFSFREGACLGHWESPDKNFRNNHFICDVNPGSVQDQTKWLVFRLIHVDVSKNSGTPKWMVYKGQSY